MLERILRDETLADFFSKDCCENEVCISFDEEVEENDYLIIKVDKYYNSLNLEDTPPSPDCLIIRRCKVSGCGLTIVELKNIDSSSAFDLQNMKAKFATCFEDFIKIRFKDLLYIDYQDIKLYFVSNIDIYKKRDLGLKLEVLINTKFQYKEKKYMIQPKMPHPTIKNCYG